MSRFEVKIPKSGESITEGTIVSWSTKVGDIIREDDVLFEVNTAKVSAEIPSPVASKVVEILFKEEDAVAVGTVATVVDMGGEETSDEETASGEETPRSKENASSNAKKVSSQIAKAEERWYSSVVIQLARGASIPKKELDSIQGTGYEGRLSKKDIKDYIGKKKRGISEASKAAILIGDTLTVSMPSSTEGIGSMTTSLVAASMQTPVAVPSAPSKQALAATNTPEVEVKEMDRIRRIIADHMAMSKKISPHVTNIMEVDVTKLVRWREKNKNALFHRGGVKLTYIPVIIEAAAEALAVYPQVNVSVGGHNILLKKHINVGVAVSLNSGNLIVPMIHDADHLNLSGLTVAIDSLALKARDNKLMPDDIDEGTFTITGFGTFKSLFGTPVINQPQVTILGVGYIEKKPAVIETPEGDMTAIRHKMYLSLSYDHHVVGGMLGGGFLHFIAGYLESWRG